MKLLNLCAGANRNLSPEWTNLDQLLPVLAPGTHERFNLLLESNYVEHDVLSGPLPFPDDTFDGVLASHCVEHWECNEAAKVMSECRRVLKTGGILLVSVPDTSYAREVHDRDTVENAIELFGEPIHLPDGETTFLAYGYFNRWHKMLLTEDSLWAHFIRAGFPSKSIHRLKNCDLPHMTSLPVLDELKSMLNRIPFSLVTAAVKE